MFVLCVCVSLTEVRVIWEKGTSVKKINTSFRLNGRVHITVGGANPEQVVLGAVRD